MWRVDKQIGVWRQAYNKMVKLSRHARGPFVVLGRVDGFDQDEARRESDEGCEVSHCLLAS